MKIFMFHLMPWAYLPASYEGPAWVKCPNSHYDARRGHDLYNRYIDELMRAEALGFDGVCVNEHHANAYGNMPSPNLIAAILARQPARMRIAVVGNALPLYNPPIRVAEEYAMIDVISGGRLIAGMVVGGGPEYYSNGLNPAEARGRFNEALDLILRCWTEPGPFVHNGKHYKLRYVNPWPTPLQKPHPPIWIPGAGSYETMDFVARRRWAYMGSPATVREQMAEMARWLGVGNVLTLLQLGTLPADLTRRNMELFAAEVMPHLRRELDLPVAPAAAASGT